MRRYLTNNTIANEARLRRSYTGRPTIIVQDVKLKKILDENLHYDNYSIIIAHSTNKVIDTMYLLERSGFTDVSAIIENTNGADTDLFHIRNLFTLSFTEDGLENQRFAKQAIDELEKHHLDSDSMQTMLASEQVLRRDWDTAEEDKAWEDL